MSGVMKLLDRLRLICTANNAWKMRIVTGGLLVAAVIIALLLTGRDHSQSSELLADEQSYELPDTLRVATLYSPTSYFIYKQELMGFDYSLVKKFAKDKGIEMSISVAPNLQDMIEWLDSGYVDLIAYEVPMTAENMKYVRECGPRSESYQVLVQPKKKKQPLIADETQLIGCDIYVEADSKYYHRLVNLNEELGGGVNIHIVDRDTIITDDLIRMVSAGEIPLTVVDNNIALINRTYYSNIDVSLPLSFPQRSAWAVAPSNQWLADSIDGWLSLDEPRHAKSMLMKRYFELSKVAKPAIKVDFTKGHISPYDHLFRQYADSIGFDWRLLAAQGYAESRFDSSLTSWVGAKGIMQIMPRTAVAYGSDPDRLEEPEVSIATAVRMLADLQGKISRHVHDPAECVKFVLGGYNCGIAHIYDAMALARKYGYDPQVWDGNVADCLILKSNPEYYNDPVCKYGYAQGLQTVSYVTRVLDFYNAAIEYIPK